jgi:hypothetical protein
MRNNFFVCARKQGNGNNHHVAQRNFIQLKTKIRFQLAPRLALCVPDSQRVDVVKDNMLPKDKDIFEDI